MHKKFLQMGKEIFVKKGFTLTEMMTVAVILSVLVAVVVGSFRSSLERAKFNEGLQAAETIAAAVERYYYDNQDLAENARQNPTFDQLDIDLSNARPCVGGVEVNGQKPYCRRIKNFEVQIEGPVSWSSLRYIPVKVVAYRGTAAASALNSGSFLYQILAIPSFVKSLEPMSGANITHRNQIFSGGGCTTGNISGGTRKARDLCYVMGYTQQCSSVNLSELADPTNNSHNAFCKR